MTTVQRKPQMCEHIFKINKTLKDDWGTPSNSVLVIYARELNTYVCQNRMAPFWNPHIISKHQMLPLGAGISGTRHKCRNLIYSQQWLIASQKGISPSTNGPLVWKGIHRVPPFLVYVLGMGNPYSMAHGNNEESRLKAKISGTKSCSPWSSFICHYYSPCAVISCLFSE